MELQIVSPEAQLFSGEVESVTVPGKSGSFQILNNHAPIVSSLKKGKVEIKGDIQIDKEFEKIPDIEYNRKDYDIISYECELGDAMAFNYATIHAAYGNNSNNRRRAFSVRFTGDDATYIKRKGEMSPPFPNVKLKKGQALDSKTFPILVIGPKTQIVIFSSLFCNNCVM